MITRRLFVQLVAGSSLAGAFPLISHAQAATDKHGGTLTFARPSEPPILLHLDRNGPDVIADKIVEGLLKIDLDLNYQPVLAESWDISDDALRYTFHLRDGVTWHDGKPFTSDDVAFSLLTLKEKHSRRRSTFANVTAVETPDPLTAVVVLSKPAPYLLGALTARASPIVPKHVYEGKDIGTDPASSAPVGTGPFVFREWARGSHIILDRNPNYWDQPKPFVDRVVVRFIPDASALLAAFEAGEIDLAGMSPVALTELPRIEQSETLGVETRGYETYGSQVQVFFNLQNPILNTLPVRKAIAHAVNAEALIDVVWLGYAKPSPTPISPFLSQFHDESIKWHAYDPAVSEKLLDEAGYPKDGAGKRFPVRILYNGTPGSNLARTAEFIRQSLIEVGIDARIENHDYATYVKRVYTDREFDLDLEVYSNGYDPTDGIQRGYWSKNIKVGLPWSNASHYANPEVDELLESAAEEPDEAKRRDLYNRFQAIIDRDLPALNLIAPIHFTVFNKRLKDHTPDVDGIFGSFADAWIDRNPS